MRLFNLQRNCVIHLFISSLIYCFGIPRAHFAQLHTKIILTHYAIQHNMILSVDNHNTLLSHRDYYVDI